MLNPSSNYGIIYFLHTALPSFWGESQKGKSCLVVSPAQFQKRRLSSCHARKHQISPKRWHSPYRENISESHPFFGRYSRQAGPVCLDPGESRAQSGRGKEGLKT